ncbi:MAG: GntR family transcriptional regulator [Clostridiales bacterium]|nr:GntR family transcriptional regulator [Clostridiales bacterium]
MISVDYRSRVPLYQQLVENVENLTARGLLKPDSQLPSVRSLAMELAINPNTIQRAYTELERRGVVYSLAGRGSFIASSPDSLVKAKQERLLTQIAACIDEGLDLGLTKEELLNTCHKAAQTIKAQTINKSEKGCENHD